MDNVQCFNDLKNNLEFLTPEDIIDLFPSKDDFLTNIGGVVAVTLLPRVVQTTMANPNIMKTRSQQLKQVTEHYSSVGELRGKSRPLELYYVIMTA